MFLAGSTYSRKDVLRALGLADPGGGAWYTGLTKYREDHYIFCGVGAGGRTGHNYQNYFDGPELVWHGRTGSAASHDSIQALLSEVGSVFIFFRDDDRAPFVFAGVGKALSVRNTVPVEIRWSFADDKGPHPEILPDQAGTDQTVVEGAKRTITVNVYERDPAARVRCIRRWGSACCICEFDFAAVYGDLGKGYIHVHHLKPLAEIGEEYRLNPEQDLRPVCPNCHAMIHRLRPAMAIDELAMHLAKYKNRQDC